ncbi:MAG: LSm family protein [Candidatus Aenigmatarchaeota archaeon]
MGEDGKRPLDALENARGDRVIANLKNGEKIAGKLVAFDLHLNLWLENAEKMGKDGNKTKLGTIVVRGDNVIFASPE